MTSTDLFKTKNARQLNLFVAYSFTYAILQPGVSRTTFEWVRWHSGQRDIRACPRGYCSPGQSVTSEEIVGVTDLSTSLRWAKYCLRPKLTLMYVSWWTLARYSMLSKASIPGGVWMKSMAGFTWFCIRNREELSELSHNKKVFKSLSFFLCGYQVQTHSKAQHLIVLGVHGLSLFCTSGVIFSVESNSTKLKNDVPLSLNHSKSTSCQQKGWHF